VSNKGQHGGVGAEFGLHPLIHALLEFAQAQDVEKKNETKDSDFSSLNQDIVAWSQEQKWGLKYVICRFS